MVHVRPRSAQDSGRRVGRPFPATLSRMRPRTNCSTRRTICARPRFARPGRIDRQVGRWPDLVSHQERRRLYRAGADRSNASSSARLHRRGRSDLTRLTKCAGGQARTAVAPARDLAVRHQSRSSGAVAAAIASTAWTATGWRRSTARCRIARFLPATIACAWRSTTRAHRASTKPCGASVAPRCY